MVQGRALKRAAVGWGVSVLALLLCTCGSSQPPLPSILAVDPPSMPADSRFLLTVELDGPPPLKLSYSEDAVELIATASVSLADREFEVPRAQEAGSRLTVEIIPWLPVGLQDLRVQFQDGRQTVLEKGFEVKPPLTLTGFQIDAIGAQVREQPFSVTLRALGPAAALFQGRVIVRSTEGNVNPKVSDAFKAGVLVQELTGHGANVGSMAIIVEDYAGHSGISNEFLMASP
jgi:hypothetical protein